MAFIEIIPIEKTREKYCPQQYYALSGGFYRSDFYKNVCQHLPCRGNCRYCGSLCWPIIEKENAGEDISKIDISEIKEIGKAYPGCPSEFL